jgi:hypothetical protein
MDVFGTEAPGTPDNNRILLRNLRMLGGHP